jgi:DNA replication and repair protein RecF
MTVSSPSRPSLGEVGGLAQPGRISTSAVLSVTSLSLHHFRNYDSCRLEVAPGPVVLTGRNGAGKTNILEALSLLTPGRGLRRARLSELDNNQTSGQPWAVAASIMGMQGEAKIGTGRDPANPDQPDKRITKIDGKEVPQAELARHMAMIWLTPQMEQLFNEGTSAARKFLDRLTYSFDPEHASRVNEYEYAMRERNRLLLGGSCDPAWLDALEQTMAETGAAVAQARLVTCANINHAVAVSTLSFPKAHIAVHGWIEDRLQAGEAAVSVEEKFKEFMASRRALDGAAGRTLEGVHRSEMRVTHTAKSLPAEACSTGEQKAMLLSIVLAQGRAAMLWKGVIPVLLLDEVIAHLDPIRRLELFEEICQIGAQIWMTGTDPNPFSGLEGKAQFFQVDNGHLKTIAS